MEKITNTENLLRGMTLIDKENGQDCYITDLTSNSVEVFLYADKRFVKSKAKSEEEDGDDDGVEIGKLKGINAKNWFTIENFYKRFEITEKGDFKCGKCGTFTVERHSDLGRSGWGYDEIWWWVYNCSKCESETWISKEEDSNKEGDMIDF